MRVLCRIELNEDLVVDNLIDEFFPLKEIRDRLINELEAELVFENCVSRLDVYIDSNKRLRAEKIVSSCLDWKRAPDVKDIYKISFTNKQNEELEKEGEEIMMKDLEKALKEKLGTGTVPTDPTDPKEDEPKEEEVDPSKEILDKINNLISCDELKALANELALVAPQLHKTRAYDAFNHNCYIFAINDGAGYTTYIKLLRDLLCTLNLRAGTRYYGVGGDVTELKYGDKIIDKIEDAVRGSQPLISIDISESINKTNTGDFKAMLTAIEEMRAHTSTTIVFRVPYVERGVISSLVYSLNDILNVKAVTFPPFSVSEIEMYAKKAIKALGFDCDDSAWESFHERMSEEKADGKFYGLKTVNKVIRELIYNKQLANAKSDEPSTLITAKDTEALCVYKPLTGESVDKMFESLVGGEALKDKIYEIVSQVQMAKSTQGAKPPCIHMRFVGNPGTGKTTVARIVGKVFKEKGILRLGGFYEYAGRDLVGRYIGETAPKTASICRDAYGSVLFIDEAYSLYRGNSNGNDFGREAIDTLIAEMENHRDDMVVIMAGYTDDMNIMMQGNAGLASRVPYTIEFPNFTREQLHKIFVSMLKSSSIGYEEQVISDSKEYFDSLPDKMLNAKSFSNGRFVRNLYERTWAKTCRRTQLDPSAKASIISADFAQAITDAEFLVTEKKPTRARIGF